MFVSSFVTSFASYSEASSFSIADIELRTCIVLYIVTMLINIFVTVKNSCKLFVPLIK